LDYNKSENCTFEMINYLSQVLYVYKMIDTDNGLDRLS